MEKSERDGFQLNPVKVVKQGNRRFGFWIHACKRLGGDKCSKGCVVTSRQTYYELASYIKSSGDSNPTLYVSP